MTKKLTKCGCAGCEIRARELLDELEIVANREALAIPEPESGPYQEICEVCEGRWQGVNEWRGQYVCYHCHERIKKENRPAIPNNPCPACSGSGVVTEPKPDKEHGLSDRELWLMRHSHRTGSLNEGFENWLDSNPYNNHCTVAMELAHDAPPSTLDIKKPLK